MAVEVICKFSKLSFEAPTKRTQVHPTIAWWKIQANKKGWYGRFFEAIDYSLSQAFDKIEQFEEVLEKASRGEPFKTPQPAPAPHCLRDTLNALLGEHSRESGSFLKRLESIDSRKENGYSLLGEFLDSDSDIELSDGLYLDCATIKKSNTDVSKGRKAYSYYTLFILKQNRTEVLLSFTGRRLNECPEQLHQVWSIAMRQGLSDSAVQARQEEQQLHALKHSAPVKFLSSKFLGTVGAVIEHEGQTLYVLAVNTVNYYEDDDGVTHTTPPRGGYMFEHFEHTYYCRLANDAEVAEELEKKQQKVAVAEALKRLKEIASAGNREFPRPKAEVSQEGMRISFRDKKLSYDSPYLQIDKNSNRLWSVFYNGRDGDDWSYNNYGNSVASFQLLTPELVAEVEACAKIIAAAFPEVIKHL